MKYIHLIAAAFFLLLSHNTYAQGDYVPDRPGIGSGSYVTEPGVFGLETGIQLSTDDFVNQFDVGQMLLRFGVVERLEVRALLNSFSTQNFESSDVTNSGFQDVGLAAKYLLYNSRETGTNVAASAKVSFPVGASAFTKNEVVPTVFVLYDQSLTGPVSISANAGYTFAVGDLDENWLLSLTPSLSIPGAEHIGLYGGYAGILHGDGVKQHYVEAGATLVVNEGAQLDINGGYELEMEVLFIGMGFAQGF